MKNFFMLKGRFIIILLFLDLFTPALADSFTVEFEWQQVSSSLQGWPNG